MTIRYQVLAVTLIAAASIGLSASMANANPAATETPVQTSPAPSSTPDPAALPACTHDFVNAYIKTASELKTAASYLNAGENPPNLVQAASACEAIEAAYLNVTCRVGRAVPVSSTDLLGGCNVVKALNARNTNKPPVTGAAVSDESPVATLNAQKITIKVGNAREVQKGINESRAVFYIKGRALSLVQASMSNETVRCTLFKPTPVPLVVKDGEIFGVAEIEETFVSGSHFTRLILANQLVAIDCATQTGKAISLGELKTAFGSLLEFTVAQ
jgi:hypothetical protein